MIPETQELHRLLRPVVRRLAITAAARVVARAATAGAGALLLWGLLTTVFPVPFPLPRVAPALAAALAALALVAARRARPPLLLAARVADRRAVLADRLGTAVDLLSRGTPPTGLGRLQIRDALRAAAAVEPRAVAPVRMRRDAWLAIAVCLALAAWGRFGTGLTLPGTPAGRTAATIHREGRFLVDLGRRLDEAGRAAQLPETLHTAPAIQDTGRRLEAPRVGWDDAVGRVREMVRRLEAAQEGVRRRVDEALSGGRADRSGARAPADGRRDEMQRVDAARLALQELANSVGQGVGTAMSAEELARRLRALSDSLDQLGAPPGVRASVDRARRAAEQGQRSAAGAGIGDALQDLAGLERMLGDEQALGDAKRQVQQSGERIAQAGRAAGRAQSAQQSGSDTSPPTASGPNPLAPGPADAPPPPGPNQGSLPGRGTGGQLGAATPRLSGTRSQSRLEGLPAPGTTHVQEIVGPGRAEAARATPGRPPADVTHEIDRTLARDPLPPAYVTLIRRYFDLGGTP
ncbi:MAG TPA: hypothetical protein VGZ23_06350 [bacterium]|nr:hypothetical protein [bacterium]